MHVSLLGSYENVQVNKGGKEVGLEPDMGGQWAWVWLRHLLTVDHHWLLEISTPPMLVGVTEDILLFMGLGSPHH